MDNFKRNIFRTVSEPQVLLSSLNFSVANGSGTTGYTTACTSTEFPQLVYCLDTIPTIGSILYQENTGATEFAGANLWYKDQGSNKAFRVDGFGVVYDEFTC